MSPFPGEFIGTALLMVLGDGVVANVVLNRTKGQNSGLIVIAIGWAMAVFVGVYASAASSGAHLNPAVTIAFASLGKISWGLVPAYLAGQLLGAMAGAFLVWVAYRQHFAHTVDKDAKLAVFCTAPAIRSPLNNLLTEAIATFVLIMGVLYISKPANSLGALDALPVGLLVLGVGLCLGGPTGYAINPARDLGPRIMHFLLPIPQKRDSDWGYAWIPIAGPIIGALLAALVYDLTPAFTRLF
ncbi:MAG: aquaporin family protein [Puia sp.]|nr:aquaporin family protein [Puia sp.]